MRKLWTEDYVTFEGKYYRVENARLNTPFVSRAKVGPEIFLGGNSPQAAELAARHASCLLRLPDAPGRRLSYGPRAPHDQLQEDQ